MKTPEILKILAAQFSDIFAIEHVLNDFFAMGIIVLEHFTSQDKAELKIVLVELLNGQYNDEFYLTLWKNMKTCLLMSEGIGVRYLFSELLKKL